MVKFGVILLFIVFVRGTRQLAALYALWFSGVFNGAALVFFAFLGFDAVAMAAEEVEDAKKNVPRGMVPLRSQLSCILYIIHTDRCGIRRSQ